MVLFKAGADIRILLSFNSMNNVTKDNEISL